MKKRFDDDLDILPFGEDIPETDFEHPEWEEDPEAEDAMEFNDRKKADIKRAIVNEIKTTIKIMALLTIGYMIGVMAYDPDLDGIPDRRLSLTENPTSVTAQTEEITEEQTEKTTLPSGSSGENPEDWKNTVFGSKNADTVFSRIRVSGLLAEDIAGSGFSETAFVKAAGRFLKEQGINAKEIRFKEKTIASPEGSCSWRAEIAGNKDKDLLAIWYPEYPGRYILMILDMDNPSVSSENTEDLSGAGNAGNERTENTPVQSSAPQMQNVQDSGQRPVRQAEPSYDATRLSVRNIPETLLNYISNRYDFQYSLYDYLYRNGHREAESATVTGYEIDPDRREAAIDLSISDGSHVTGTYRMSDHSFSYRMG